MTMRVWEYAQDLPRQYLWRLKQYCTASPVPQLSGCCAQLEQLQSGFTPAQLGRYAELSQHYDLSQLCTYLNAVQWRENLYVLDVLDSYFTPLGQAQSGLEIGCRNFSYLPALRAFRPLAWHGVEVDAYARYWNGCTRAAYGQAWAACYEDCQYHGRSLMALSGAYEAMVWFLPFLFADTQRAYGLPRRYFEPLTLLTQAYTLLRPGGVLLIVNQGPEEHEEQQRLCRLANVPWVASSAVTSVFSPFRQPRFALRVVKPLVMSG